MPTDGFEVRVSFKRLVIGILVTIVPISLLSIYAVTQSDHELQGTIGAHFKVVAESTSQNVADFIHDRVVEVGTMASEPSLLAAIAAGNDSYRGMSDDAVSNRIQQIEKTWNEPEAAARVSAMLANEASSWLRRFRDVDRRFLRITVTDGRGATVAASDKTLDYYQADEDYWQAIYANGRGAVSVTDVLHDDVTNSSYIGVGVPVLEQGSNRFLGTVDALVDVSSLFGVVNQPHPPLNLRTTLVKDDGSVISAPEVDLSMKLNSAEFAAVKDELTTLEGRQTGYVVTDVTGLGKRVIGFADTGLKDDYKNLGWVVLVSEDAQVAFASIRAVGRLTATLGAVGLALAAMFVAYFSLHRKQPYTDLTEVEEGPPQAEAASS